MAASFTPTGTFSNLSRLQLEQLRKADFFAGGKGLTVGDSALPPEGVVGPGDINAEPYLTQPSILLDDVYSLTPPQQPGETLLTISQTSDLASETVKWFGPQRILDGLSTGTVTVGGATPVLTDTTQNFSLSVLAGDTVLFKSGSQAINQNQYAVASVTVVTATTLTLGSVNNSFAEPGTPTQLNADADTYTYVIVRANAVQLFAVPGSGATGFEQTFMMVLPGTSLHATVAPTTNAINAARVKSIVPPQYTQNTAVDRADSVFPSPAPRTSLDKLGYRVVLYPDNGSNAPNLAAPITTLNPIIDPGIPSTDQRMTIDYKAGIVRFSCAPQVGGQIKQGVNPTTGRLNLYAVFWAVDQSLVQGASRRLWTTRSTPDVAYPAAKVFWDPTNIAWRFGSTESTNSAYIRAVGAQDDPSGITEFGAIAPAASQQRRYVGYRPVGTAGSGKWVMVGQDVAVGGDAPMEQQIQDKTKLTVGDTSSPPLAAGDVNPGSYITGAGARSTGTAMSTALTQAMAGGFGTVHLRRGRYYVTTAEAPIVVPPGIVLEGEDLSTIVQARVFSDTTVISTLPVFKFGPNTRWRVYDSTYNTNGNTVTPVTFGMPTSERIEGHDLCWNPVRRVWGIAIADASTNTILFNEVNPAGTKTFTGTGVDLKNSTNNLFTSSSPNSSNHTTGHYPRIGYNESTDQYTVVWCEEFTSSGSVVGPTVWSQTFSVLNSTTTPSISPLGTAVQHQANPSSLPFSAHPSLAIDQTPTVGFLYELAVVYWAYATTNTGAITASSEWRHIFNEPNAPNTLLNTGTSLTGPQVVSSTDVASDMNDGFLYAFARRFHPIIFGTQGVITLTATSGGFSYLTDSSVSNWGNLGVQPGSKFMYLGVNPTTLPATVTSQFLFGNVSYGTDGVVYDTTSAVNQARVKIAQTGYVYNTLTSWQEITSVHGGVSLGGNQLNDTTVNFLTAGVQNGDTLFEQIGAVSHFHKITGVSATQLTIADTFSANASNQTYYVFANQPFNWAMVPQSAIDTYRYVQSGGFTGETSGQVFAVGQSVNPAGYVMAESEPDFVRLARGSGDNWLLVYQSFNTTSLFSKPTMGNFDDNVNTSFLDQATPLALQDYQAPWREHVSTCAVVLSDVGFPIYPSGALLSPHSTTAPGFIPRSSRDVEVTNRSLGARVPITKRPNYIRGATNSQATITNSVGASLNYTLQVSPLCFCHRWTGGSSLIPDVDWSGTDWTVVSPTKKSIHGYTGTYIVTGASAGQTYFGDPMFYFGAGGGNAIDGNYLQATVAIGDRIFFPSTGVTATIAAIHSEHIVQLTQADSAILNKGSNGHYQNTEWVLQRTNLSVQTSGGGLKNAGFRVSADGHPTISTTYVTFADNPSEDQFATTPDEVHLMRRTSTDTMFGAFNFNFEGTNFPGVLYEDTFDPHSRYMANINFQGVAPGEPKGCNELSSGEAPTVALAWGETVFGLLDHVVAGGPSRANYVGFYRQSFGPYYNGIRNLTILGNTQTPFTGASSWTQLKTLSRQRVFTRHGEPNASSAYFATDGYRNCFTNALQIYVQSSGIFPNPLNNLNFVRMAATFTDAIGRNPITMQGPRSVYNVRQDGTTASAVWSGFPQAPSSMTPLGMSHPRVLWDGSRFAAFWVEGGSHIVNSMPCAMHMITFPGDEDTGPQGPELVAPLFDDKGPRILQTQHIEIRPNIPPTTSFLVTHDVAFSGRIYASVWTAGLDPSQATNPCILGVTLFDGQGLGNRMDTISLIHEGVALAMPSETGTAGSGSGTAIFTDAAATFNGAGGVVQGDILIVHSGAAQGRYNITGVISATQLQTDQVVPTGSGYAYSVHHTEYAPGAATYILGIAAWAPISNQEQVAFVTPKILWNGHKFVVMFGNHQHGLNTSGYSGANVLGVVSIPENGLTTPVQIKRVASMGAHIDGVSNPGVGVVSSVSGSTTTLSFSGTDYRGNAYPLYNVGDYLVVAGQQLSGNTADIDSIVGGYVNIINLGSILTSSLVGATITISGAASSGNNGTFVIMEVPGATACQILNPNAVAPDANNTHINFTINWNREDGWYPITSINWTAGTFVAEFASSAVTGATVFGSVISAPVGDPLQRPTSLVTGSQVINASSPRPMLVSPGESTIAVNPGFSYDRLHSFIYNEVDDEYALLYLNNTVGRLVFQRWKGRFDQALPEVFIGTPSAVSCADMAFNGREYLVCFGDSTTNQEILRYVLINANGTGVSSGIVDNGRNGGGVIGTNLPNQIPGQLYSPYNAGGAMLVNIRNIQVRWNNRLNRWIVSASYHWYADESFSSTAELPPYHQLTNVQAISVTGNQVTLSSGADSFYIQPGCKMLVNTFATSKVPVGVYGIVNISGGATPVLTLDTASLPGLASSGTFGIGSLVALPREDVICYTLGFTNPAVQLSDADECFIDNVSFGGTVDIEEKYRLMAQPSWQSTGAIVGQPNLFDSSFQNIFAGDFATTTVPNVHRRTQYNHMFLRPQRARAPVFTNIRSSTKVRHGFGLSPQYPRGMTLFRRG